MKLTVANISTLLLIFSHVLTTAICLAENADTMELEIDHVMFPVYNNNALLSLIESTWSENDYGEVNSGQQNNAYKGVYLHSKSFYVEYLSTVASEPYWSNAIYLVVPTEFWPAIENPAAKSDYFLIPSFGSGYQLISPDYPNLNSMESEKETYDGLTILISRALEQEILTIAGESWTLPSNGKIKVHDELVHLHDIVIIDEHSTLVAPLYEANPLLRDYF